MELKQSQGTIHYEEFVYQKISIIYFLFDHVL